MLVDINHWKKIKSKLYIKIGTYSFPPIIEYLSVHQLSHPLWEPSQNGFLAESPQRQRDTVPFRCSSRPSGCIKVTPPLITKGPLLPIMIFGLVSSIKIFICDEINIYLQIVIITFLAKDFDCWDKLIVENQLNLKLTLNS